MINLRSRNELDSYFATQISESKVYFEKWLYRKESKNFAVDNVPIPEDCYDDLYHIFKDHYRIKNNKPDAIAHNCIGCNLAEGARHINIFFRNNNKDVSESYFLSTYTLLFYIQAERLGVIYKELGYINKRNEFDWESFPALLKLKRWANFFKHPKSYMYLHHPTFYIDGYTRMPIIKDGRIDNAFVNKYYSGNGKNNDLKTLLANKSHSVIFPNLLEFTIELCSEFEKVIQIIKNNPDAVEKLSPFTIEREYLF